MRRPIRLAIAAGRRGKSFARELRALWALIDVIAVCARTPETVEHWRDEWAVEYPAIRALASCHFAGG